jgi:hypothetical protein
MDPALEMEQLALEIWDVRDIGYAVDPQNEGIRADPQEP